MDHDQTSSPKNRFGDENIAGWVVSNSCMVETMLVTKCIPPAAFTTSGSASAIAVLSCDPDRKVKRTKDTETHMWPRDKWQKRLKSRWRHSRCQ